ncbi:MAG: helix-turn-helix transcriptional regulator [Candidatus Sericytochromatia bacterium]|nr:helix-turn-helix transcriptional regulator [Candidatus Tanganyikabacteria bacterium]
MRNGSGERCCASPLAGLLDARLFKALGDPSRLNLLASLADAAAAQTVSQLAGCCPLDMSVVSRHLATLRDAGIVSAARVGKEVRYSLDCRRVAGMLRAIADALDACCPSDAAMEGDRS